MATPPVPNSSFEVAETNLKILDSFVNLTEGTVVNREGVTLTPLPVMQQTFNSLGYIDKGTFAAGATLNSSNEILSDGTDYWRWSGAFPKVVTAGSSPTPSGVGAWLNIGDSTKWAELAASDSTQLVGGVGARLIGNRVLSEVYVSDFISLPYASATAAVQAAISAGTRIVLDVDVSVNELILSSGQSFEILKDVTLAYSPTANSKFLFKLDGLDDVRIHGSGTIHNTAAKQSGGVSVITSFSGTGAVWAYNSTNVTVDGLTFNEGSHAIYFENTFKSAMRNCKAFNQQSWAYITAGCESVVIHGNYATGNVTDAFKFRGLSKYQVVTNNISEYNYSDGFDLYDGFFKSIFSNNIARGNVNFGFECKGTPAADYTFRDSVVSGNIAQGNGLQGFSIVSVRDCTFSGNQSTENTGAGYLIEGSRANAFSGNVAGKNGLHGFHIGNVSTCSNNTFSGCVARDNGKTTNDTYSGFYCTAVASNNVFSGCIANKGADGDASQQKYGIEFVSGSARNNVIGGVYEPNQTASFGGDVAAQIIDSALVAGSKQYTNKISLGTYTAGAPAAATGYISVTANDGITYKVPVLT